MADLQTETIAGSGINYDANGNADTVPAAGSLTGAARSFGYNAENAYWKSFSIRRLVRSLPEAERSRLEGRIGRISARYDDLSGAYQASKAENDIPLN